MDAALGDVFHTSFLQKEKMATPYPEALFTLQLGAQRQSLRLPINLQPYTENQLRFRPYPDHGGIRVYPSGVPGSL